MGKPVLIKKYGNRRLYDTDESRYLTLDELALKIQRGADVTVVEVKTGDDLTQATLAQIVMESRQAVRFLPVSLLTQMIRLGDDALAEFLGSYMTTTMEIYLRTVRGMQMLSPFSGMSMPNPVRETLSRFFGTPLPHWQSRAAVPYVDPEETPPPAPDDDDIAALRKEIEALKEQVSRNHPDVSKPARTSKRNKSRAKTKN